MSAQLDLETHRNMVENSPDAMLVMVDLKIVYVNKKALELYGAESPDELVGKDALAINY